MSGGAIRTKHNSPRDLGGYLFSHLRRGSDISVEEARGTYPSDVHVEDPASSVPGVRGGVGGVATTDGRGLVATMDGEELVATMDGEELVATMDDEAVVATMDGEELVISRDGEELIVTRDGEEPIVTRDGEEPIVTRDGEESIVTRDGEELRSGNEDSSPAIVATGTLAAVTWLSKARGLLWALGVAVGAITAGSGVDERGA
ncbi:hypothetical protein BU17DRAFT_61503 [Hysterangium stoloniferum]|nr:hypothetical protein BU17DRAFT_61503 [Hysterangium stoloniferum]